MAEQWAKHALAHAQCTSPRRRGNLQPSLPREKFHTTNANYVKNSGKNIFDLVGMENFEAGTFASNQTRYIFRKENMIEYDDTLKRPTMEMYVKVNNGNYTNKYLMERIYLSSCITSYPK